MPKISYRDSKGHFRNPSTFEGELFTHIDGKKVKVKGEGTTAFEERKKSKNSAKKKQTKQWQKKSEANALYRERESGKREFKISDRVPSSQSETITHFIKSSDMHTKWQERMKTYEVKTDEEGNKIASRTIDEYNQKIFQQSKDAVSKNGNGTVYDKKEQAAVLDLFDEANKTMQDWEEEYGITVGKGFHLYKSDTLETLEKKIDKAIEVTSEDYLEKLALSYKLDFISNFANHVQGEEFSNFVDAITRMDNVKFLKLIKDKHIDFLAYALDSVIDRHGYEQILSDIKYLTDRINEGDRNND